MAVPGRKRRSYWFLKTVILLGIFAGIWFLLPKRRQQNSCTVRCPQYDNLAYGVPGAADFIIEREGYALGYIIKHRQAAWVQYVLTAGEVSCRAAKRGENHFRPDPEIPAGSATLQDYARSGYERGHLAPAAAPQKNRKNPFSS